MNSVDIGIYLKIKRLEKGLTQKQLAEHLTVTHQAVSRWEKGDSIPEVLMLSKLSDLYGVTIDDIIGNSKNTDILTDQLVSEHKMKDYFFKYLLANLLSLVIFLILRSVASNMASDAGSILYAFAIIQLILLFTLSTYFVAAYFNKEVNTNRNKGMIRWYFRWERLTALLLFFLSVISINRISILILASPIILLVLLKLDEHRISVKYIKDNQSFISRFIPKNTIDKVLVVMCVVVFLLVLNFGFNNQYIVFGLTLPSIYVIYLSMK